MSKKKQIKVYKKLGYIKIIYIFAKSQKKRSKVTESKTDGNTSGV